VGVHNIYPFQLQAFQTGFEALDHVFAGQAVVVDQDFTIGATPVDL
jgi:hypothetical protein